MEYLAALYLCVLHYIEKLQKFWCQIILFEQILESAIVTVSLGCSENGVKNMGSDPGWYV